MKNMNIIPVLFISTAIIIVVSILLTIFIPEKKVRNINLDETTIEYFKDYEKYTEAQLSKESTNCDLMEVTLTSGESLVVKLFNTKTPNTVNWIKTLIDTRYYEGARLAATSEGYAADIFTSKFGEDEIDPTLFPYKGSFCVTMSQNMYQFKIITVDYDSGLINDLPFPDNVIDLYKEYGGAPWLYTNTTVCGQVIEGLDKLDDKEYVIKSIKYFEEDSWKD